MHGINLGPQAWFDLFDLLLILRTYVSASYVTLCTWSLPSFWNILLV
jgi:hypothetical protein